MVPFWGEGEAFTILPNQISQKLWRIQQAPNFLCLEPCQPQEIRSATVLLGMRGRSHFSPNRVAPVRQKTGEKVPIPALGAGNLGKFERQASWSHFRAVL